MNTENQFNGNLKKFRRYLRWHDTLVLFQRTAWYPALGVCLVQVAGRLFPLEYKIYWLCLFPILWLIILTGYSLFKPMPLTEVAIRVDMELGLKECLSSSLYFQDADSYEENKDGEHYQSTLLGLLHERARDTIKSIQIRQAFPIPFQMRRVTAAAILLLFAAILWRMPNPMDLALAERQAAREAARQQAEKIDNLKEEIAESQELDEEEKEELLQKLAELAEKLRENPGDRQEALAEINDLEKELSQRLDMGDAMQQMAIQALSTRLQQLLEMEETGGDNEEILNMALDELAQLSSTDSQTEREQLAQELAALSSQLSQSGNQAMADALAALSEAMRSGDIEAASRAASNAQQALSQSGQQHALQNALQRSLSQLQNSRQAMTQGKPQANTSGNSSQSAGNNPGNKQGQGSGAGGGSKANTLPPFQGGNVNVQSPRGLSGSADPDLMDRQVYVPRTKGETSGEELQIQGQDSGQGQEKIENQSGPLSGMQNPALVPYSDVFGSYSDTASQAMEQSYIPSDLKNYVRSYFSELEP